MLVSAIGQTKQQIAKLILQCHINSFNTGGTYFVSAVWKYLGAGQKRAAHSPQHRWPCSCTTRLCCRLSWCSWLFPYVSSEIIWKGLLCNICVSLTSQFGKTVFSDAFYWRGFYAQLPLPLLEPPLHIIIILTDFSVFILPLSHVYLQLPGDLQEIDANRTKPSVRGPNLTVLYS